MQIFHLGVVEVIVPNPVIFMLRPFEPLTEGIFPNPVPAFLVGGIRLVGVLLQPQQDSGNQFPTLFAPAIIIVAEVVISEYMD